jgi:hypothetical protein
MKGPDIFGLIVRVAGLFLIIYALWYLEYGIRCIPSWFLNRGTSEDSPFDYLVPGGEAFVLGALLFTFADWIVSLTYRTRENQGDQPTESS